MGGLEEPPPRKQPSGSFMSSNHLVTHQAHKNGQYYALKHSKILMQKKLKNDPKISNFLEFSNDLKNVCRHCGGHYNIKIKHFEDFSGGGRLLETPPSPCQTGLIT